MNTEEDWKREREEGRPCRFCDGRGWVIDRNAPCGGSPCGCDEPQDDEAPPVPSVSGGEDWITWKGGSNPVPGQRVDTRHLRGDECADWLSDQWGISWLCEDPEDGENIVAYRVSPSVSGEGGR